MSFSGLGRKSSSSSSGLTSSIMRTGSSRSTTIAICLLVLGLVAWLRIPPKVPSLLDSAETKQIFLDLHRKQKQEKQSPRVDSEFAAVVSDNGDQETESDEESRKSVNRIAVPTTTSHSRARLNYDIDPNDLVTKYFVYQPSGGWGNQRMILRWAMRLANSMERTLIVPMVAPHNKMWYGYDRLNATDMIAADRVLDMEALEAGTTHGVRIHRDHLRTLPFILTGTWKRNSRPTSMWLTENAIKAKWRGLSYRVVFWNQGSMWECCGGGTLMTPYVMFSREFKQVSLKLSTTFFKNQPYNAVHVRRGGGHTRIDRRTATHYYERKIQPAGFDPALPIYVATDEKNKTWFDDLKTQGFRIVFWDEFVRTNSDYVESFLKTFPPKTRNDVIGFLEQLICARASKWTGSDGSTFSYSIEGMRLFPSLTQVDWQAGMDAKSKRIYAHDGKGIKSATSEELGEGSGQQTVDGEEEQDDEAIEDAGSNDARASPEITATFMDDAKQN